jgi:molybdate transport system substrate-binding protein
MRFRLLLSLAVLFVGCGSATDAPAITVGAASSLQPLLDSIKPAFEEATGVEVRYSYAASGAIARQVEQGAPIDVFVLAGTRYVDDLAADGFLRKDSLSSVASGQLVVVRPLRIDGANVAFAEAERVAIANPEIAPYGAAAKAQLEAAGLWDAVEPQVVYAGSALQAFQFAKAGEVDYAFVPLPLVHISPEGLEVADHAIPGLKAINVTYAAALVDSTQEPESALAFIEYLVSPEARQADFGYNSVRGPR